MQKRLVLVLAFLLVFGFNLFSSDVTIGEKLKMKKVTNISEILTKPADFLGKNVRVEGLIVGGCHHHGTWIAVSGDKEFQKIDVRDKDGKLKFPLEHKGKYAVVEGSLYEVKLSQEKAEQWLKHLAENHGDKVDLSKAKGGMTFYKISPYAAVLKDSK